MGRFTSINLAKLPSLPLPARDFDTLYAARIAELTARLAAKGIVFDTGSVNGDPLSAAEQAGAYRELVTLTARDDAIRSVMLASAWGAFLDHLGATQVPPVARKVLVPADPVSGAAALMEEDDDFRARIQLAPEALSTCGPEGGYLFFASAVDGVLNASVYGPQSFGGTAQAPFTPPGEVRIPIVAAAGDGTATADLVAAVQAAVSGDQRRPLADFVTVSAATIVPYSIVATLYVGPGSDPSVVQAEAVSRLQAQANRQHRAGAAQLRQMLFGAAYVADATGAIIVEQVDLQQPAADVNADAISAATPDAAYRAPYCTSIAVTVEVVDD